jgi:hypothetical protein
MSGVRAAGQTLIGCWCKLSLVEKIDHQRGDLSRSQFARDAIGELLKSQGIEIETGETQAPDRKGKGRPKKYTVSSRRTHAVALNDKTIPSSKWLSRAESAARRAAEQERRRAQE